MVSIQGWIAAIQNTLKSFNIAYYFQIILLDSINLPMY